MPARRLPSPSPSNARLRAATPQRASQRRSRRASGLSAGRRFRRALAIAVLAGCLALLGFSPASVGSTQATEFQGTLPTGALFDNPDGTGDHSCTASVIKSESRDTIITAAHCVTGDGTSMSFVPDYDQGKAPYGVWKVAKAYVDPHWSSSQDPHYDVAILTVAPHTVKGRSVDIQDMTGGYALGQLPRNDERVFIPAYNAGSGDRPIRCTTKIYYTAGYPGFDCSGYDTGVSGAPLLTTVDGVRYVSGVIGGLYQGGCSSSTSYGTPFGQQVKALLARAAGHKPTTAVPEPEGNGC
ncbi:trypsin-like serine peptidase [Arthrobacter sp. UM1]|uniref:trypsin-like serine peptidase n=1 Tax=Arthrobacter sp. UM1 TaxID=2766776 RepID=UPI001CF6687E|nr:trypsin-like serine protease [Arthrobacter sp. UM1]MCB4208202.1 trypsin-like serine protease [Arthrobacter sp. UM1]